MLWVDAILLLDIGVSFNRGFYDDVAAATVLRRGDIRRRYVGNVVDLSRPSFLRDVLSIVPLNLIVEGAVGGHGLRGALRANRLLRTPRIFSLLRELLEKPLGRHPVRAIQASVRFGIMAHTVACVWYAFGLVDGFGANDWLPDAELAPDATPRPMSVGLRYLNALYRALGLMVGVVTCGEPQTAAQSLFHVAIMGTTLLLFAYAIGVVSAGTEEANKRALNFEAQIKYVRLVLRSHELPRALVDRVMSFLSYQNRNQDHLDMRVVDELPEHLQAEVMEAILQRCMTRLPLFQSLGEVQGLMETLATRFEHLIFMPREPMVTRGHLCDRLIVVVRGRAMRVPVRGSAESMQRLGPGDMCGDELLVCEPAKQSIRAYTAVECYALKRTTLIEAVSHYPDAQAEPQLARLLGSFSPAHTRPPSSTGGASLSGAGSASGGASITGRREARDARDATPLGERPPAAHEELLGVSSRHRSKSVPIASAGTGSDDGGGSGGTPPLRRPSLRNKPPSPPPPGSEPLLFMHAMHAVGGPRDVATRDHSGLPTKLELMQSMMLNLTQLQAVSPNPLVVSAIANLSLLGGDELARAGWQQSPHSTRPEKALIHLSSSSKPSAPLKSSFRRHTISSHSTTHLPVAHALLKAGSEVSSTIRFHMDHMQDGGGGDKEMMKPPPGVDKDSSFSHGAASTITSVSGDSRGTTSRRPSQFSIKAESSGSGSSSPKLSRHGSQASQASQGSLGSLGWLGLQGSATRQVGPVVFNLRDDHGGAAAAGGPAYDSVVAFGAPSPPASPPPPPLPPPASAKAAANVASSTTTNRSSSSVSSECRSSSDTNEAVAAAAVAAAAAAAEQASPSHRPRAVMTGAGGRALQCAKRHISPGKVSPSGAGNRSPSASAAAQSHSALNSASRGRSGDAVDLRRAHSFANKTTREIDDSEESFSLQVASRSTRALLWRNANGDALAVPLINPDGWLRSWWLASVLLASLYAGVAVSYRIGYGKVDGFDAAAFVPDLLCDMVLLLNVAATFRLPFGANQASLVTAAQPIAARYARSFEMPRDVVAVLPLLLCAATGYTSQLYRLPLLLQVLRTPTMLGVVWQRCSRQAEATFSARNLGVICYSFGLAVHLVASLYGATQRADAPDDSPRGAKAFTHGLWWAMTALTGFGTIATPTTPLQLGYVSAVLAGSLLTSIYIIGSMGVLISNLDAVAVTFRKRCDATDTFVQRHQLPDGLSRRMRIYQRQAWIRGSGRNLEDAIGLMNPSIRTDVMRHICQSIVTRLPLFEGCGPTFIDALYSFIRLEVFPQSEWVCHKGSIASALYIVMKGTVSIVIDEAKMVVVARLFRGDFFGERALFTPGETRNASVRARTAVELVKLEADAFRKVLKAWPEVQQQMLEAKEKREAETAAAKAKQDDAAKVKEVVVAPSTTPPRVRRRGSIAAVLGGSSSAPDTKVASFRRPSLCAMTDDHKAAAALAEAEHEMNTRSFKQSLKK